MLYKVLDCEQSLFSSKIRAKERKTSKRASVTVSVTWERRPTPTLLAARGIAAPTSLLQSHPHAYLFCVLSHGFSRKRETARSLKKSKLPACLVFRNRALLFHLKICFFCFIVSSKYGTTRKNTQRYYTTKRLIRYMYCIVLLNTMDTSKLLYDFCFFFIDFTNFTTSLHFEHWSIFVCG